MEDKIVLAREFLLRVMSTERDAEVGIRSALLAMQILTQGSSPAYLSCDISDQLTEAVERLRLTIPPEMTAHGAARVTMNIALLLVRRATLDRQSELKPEDEELFDLLVDCTHVPIQKIIVNGKEDPAVYESMLNTWYGRVKFARLLAELREENGLRTIHEAAAVYNLDVENVRAYSSLGRALIHDPELGCRLVRSTVPFGSFDDAFSFEGYMRIKDRLHMAWGMTVWKRPRRK